MMAGAPGGSDRHDLREGLNSKGEEMRPAREITAEEENFRMEEFAPGMSSVKRDPIKPEPEGTIILKAFRITGYDQDCDGGLMAKLDCIDRYGEETGWSPDSLGINPETCLVINQEELASLFAGEKQLP